MIQANELRIGNYYIYDDDVIKLDGSFLATYLQNDCDLLLKPISLTEEWKEKLKNTPVFMDKEGFVIFKNGYSYAFVWKDYPFLHQLQNIYFALTGTELEIK